MPRHGHLELRGGLLLSRIPRDSIRRRGEREEVRLRLLDPVANVGRRPPSPKCTVRIGSIPSNDVKGSPCNTGKHRDLGDYVPGGADSGVSSGMKTSVTQYW